MRRTPLALAITAGAVLPVSLLSLSGTAFALANANTYGTTTGTSVLVTGDATATCAPTAPTKPSDAFCKYKVRGSVKTTSGPTGPASGSYFGTVTLDYGFAAASSTSCAAARGSITFFVRQGGKAQGSFTTRLRPATTANPMLSKVCATGQSPADSDVATSFFTGVITKGTVSSFPVCGTTENRGSSVKVRTADGTLTPDSRDASNSVAALGIKSSGTCNYPPAG